MMIAVYTVHTYYTFRITSTESLTGNDYGSQCIGTMTTYKSCKSDLPSTPNALASLMHRESFVC